MFTLEEKLGYRFKNRALLENALQHSSYANEHRGAGMRSNERLEFLGDAVLGVVTADYLYKKHPDLPEGDLTRIRAALVCEESLHEVAQGLDLGRHLKLGRGEEQGGGRERPSILADATESVFAAVYLDGGMEAAAALIHRVLLDKEREEAVEEGLGFLIYYFSFGLLAVRVSSFLVHAIHRLFFVISVPFRALFRLLKKLFVKIGISAKKTSKKIAKKSKFNLKHHKTLLYNLRKNAGANRKQKKKQKREEGEGSS